MSGKDEWKSVEKILSNVFNEEDTEKLVYSMKTSVKHEIDQIVKWICKEDQ